VGSQIVRESERATILAGYFGIPSKLGILILKEGGWI
jgi:hypothetical protein